MNVTSLTARLRLAASMVRQGARVADVGCDHGKLSAFLLQSGKTPFVYATDIRPLPLASARMLLEGLGLSDKCCCMQTDGLNGIDAEMVDDVVIAGIGADISAGIIEAAPWLKDERKRLILVPASKHERLRAFLCRNGFATLCEKACFDKGHMYTVILAQYDGKCCEPSLMEKWFGKLDLSCAEGVRYLELVRSRMQKITENVDDPSNASLVQARELLEATDGLRRR